MKTFKSEIKTRHNGPYDRGSADKFYGRTFEPHYKEGRNIIMVEAGSIEWKEYQEGFNEETASKL